MITPSHSLDSVTSAPLSPERLELREAAQAFEAIMVRQLLAAARAGSIGDQGPLSGPGLKQFETMRDEQFADLASQSGMLGLAYSIEQQLAVHLGDKEI